MATEFVQGKPCTYPSLTPSKGIEVTKPEKEAYLFDIFNDDHNFVEWQAN